MSTSAQPATEQVQKCGLCQKPYLKESSYNRHVLYCRRTRNRPRARAKVCHACTSAKVKCDLQPRCQRCINKGIECVYDTERGLVTNGSSPAPSTPAQSVPLSPTTDWVPNEATPQNLNQMYLSRDTCMDVDWDLLDFQANPFLPQSPKTTLPHLSEPIMRPEGLPVENSHGTEVLEHRRDEFASQNFLFPGIPWSIQAEPEQEQSNALVRCAESVEETTSETLFMPLKVEPMSNSTVQVVMQILRAFPQMMLRRETLPPFIHGHWYREPGTEPALPEPLINCMGITQIFASHSPDIRSFLWRTIQTEQQSTYEKSNQGKLAKQALLASIQAQLIYMIMRLTDRSTPKPGYNSGMSIIRQPLCNNFKDLCKQPFFEHESNSPCRSWEEWIFAESRRRAAIVWFLVTQVVCIEIGLRYEPIEEFRKIPLPAPRSLWEARTRTEWQTEYDLYNDSPKMGMETIGDLINVSKQADLAKNNLRIDLWNARIDSLGILLNLSVAVM